MEQEQKNHIKSMPLFILPLLVGTFLGTLNITSINIALPTLISHFHTDMATMQWIIVGYMLMNGLAMPTLGYFNNRFSGRNLLAFGFILLTFVSILCAMH